MRGHLDNDFGAYAFLFISPIKMRSRERAREERNWPGNKAVDGPDENSVA